MNAKGIEQFNAGVQALLLAEPFYGALLLKLKHVPKEGIGTLATDGAAIYYDPEFMALQNEDQAMFCVAHEVGHCAWMHHDRIKHYIDTGIGPDGHALDMKLFNMALDYPMNHGLLVGRHTVGEYPAGIKICLDNRYHVDMTPEEVYCDLKQRQDAGESLGDAHDEHLPSPGAGDGTADGTPQQGAITAADVMQAASACKAVKGTLPAGIDRLLGGITKPQHSPWKRLRKAVNNALSGHDSTTWRRLQRRMIVRGVGMPGRTLQGAGHVGIVLDVSGSIDDEMLALFGGHMAAIIDDARPSMVTIYWTDTAVVRVDTVKNGTQLRSLLGKGAPAGGGTDMPVGVAAARADKCDAVVVLSDGWTPFCEGNVIWAITTQGLTSPYGTTIFIN